MKKNDGFFLLVDIIVFMLSSLLILSAATAFSKCIQTERGSAELWNAFEEAQAHLSGETGEGAFYVTCATEEFASMVFRRVNVARDGAREKIICSLVLVER